MLTIIKLFLKFLPIAILIAYIPKSMIPNNLSTYHNQLTNYILPITDPFIEPLKEKLLSTATTPSSQNKE